MGKVPPNLGLVFRQFAQSYDRKLKQDIPISKESRRWWHRLLEQLAWVMTCGETKTELQVAIPRQQAEAVLTEFLAGKVAHPEDCALCWLDDLLNHHLIQLGTGDQIEFRHQLIQEYYTAESLLKLLPSLSDNELKREYLNYLKWTPTLALMLELVEDEAQAVRVVKLALEVDLRLGARLAGAVKPEFQEQTIALVNASQIPQLLKIELLSETHSDSAIPLLNGFLKDEDYSVRLSAVNALGQINSEATTKPLIQALQNIEDFEVFYIAAKALGETKPEAVIQTLIQALTEDWEYAYYEITSRVAEVLGAIKPEAAIQPLIQALQHEDSYISYLAADVLGKIRSESATEPLIKALHDEASPVRSSAADVLGKIKSESAIQPLIQTLHDEDSSVRSSAAKALGQLKSEAAIQPLIQALHDEDSSVRSSAAKALGQLKSEAAIQPLIQALQDEDFIVHYTAAEALGKIKSEIAIQRLILALADKDSLVRCRAAEALSKIGTPESLPDLYELLQRSGESHLLDTISVIQERCNFYSYTLTQL